MKKKRRGKSKTKRKLPDGVAVRRSSAGLGLFATKPFKKGDFIIEYVGRTISTKEQYTSRSKYLFEINARKTIDGKPAINPAGYINHACSPNCETDIRRGRIFVEAKRRIKPGEELTYDYGKEYFHDHIRPHGCRCVKHKKPAPHVSSLS